jgi:hypothetical protein
LFVDYSVLILNKNLIDNKIKNIAGCVVWNGNKILGTK